MLFNVGPKENTFAKQSFISRAGNFCVFDLYYTLVNRRDVHVPINYWPKSLRLISEPSDQSSYVECSACADAMTRAAEISSLVVIWMRDLLACS